MSTNDDNYLELTPIILEGSSQKTNDGLSVVKLGLYMGIAFFFATLIIIIVLPRVILCIRGYFLTETKIKEKRQKKIDKWIITKHVPKHISLEATTSSSDTCSGNDEDAMVDVEAPNDETVDSDRGQECLICMDSFSEGDSVAFSIHCDHVFHHQCIAEWLLKHNDCPYCRRSVIPEKKLTRKHSRMLKAEKQKKSEATNFTVEDGLVKKAAKARKESSCEIETPEECLVMKAAGER